jgi:hypothetical protein
MRRVAPVLTLLLLAALSACTSSPKEAGPTTLTVLLDHEVTAAQKGVVPDLLADLNPECTPESFRATVTDAPVAEAVELVMGTVDGVEAAVLKIADVDPLWSRIGTIVRLKPTAMAEQRAAVEEVLRAQAHAESIEFEDRDAAYERLCKQCRGKGDLATQLNSQVMRASLRLQPPLNGKARITPPDIERLDGVETVRLVPVAML